MKCSMWTINFACIIFMKSDGYKDKAFKDALWTAATSCNVVDFNTTMIEIEVIYPSAYRKLMEIDIALWSKHAFGVACKSDTCYVLGVQCKRGGRILRLTSILSTVYVKFCIHFTGQMFNV